MLWQQQRQHRLFQEFPSLRLPPHKPDTSAWEATARGLWFRKAGIAAVVANRMGSAAKNAKEGSELLKAQQRALRRRVRVPFPPISGRGKEEGGTWVRPAGGGAQIKGGRLRPPPASAQ